LSRSLVIRTPPKLLDAQGQFAPHRSTYLRLCFGAERENSRWNSDVAGKPQLHRLMRFHLDLAALSPAQPDQRAQV
jgi:hypothetical protein